jgi:threonine dehydrogenase-like Zn-dependent dehydrogenase
LRCLEPEEAARQFSDQLDLAIDVSGKASGLQLGLDLLRFGGRLLAGSWLAPSETGLRVGASAHRQRQTIAFSQVSTIAPALAARFDRSRRHAIAFDWLARLPVESLITHRPALSDAASIYRQLDDQPESMGQVVFTY